MTIQEAETQFYDIFPNAENNVIKTGITLDVRDASNNKLPLEAYKVVKTYAAAESLIERHVDPSDNTVYYYDAYPGETISVVDDTDSSLNGLYFVMGTQDPSGNGLSLHRLMYSSDASSEFRLQSKIVNPSTAAIDVQPSSGYYGLGTVHVNPIDASLDPDLVPENIKYGVEIFGVIGNFSGGLEINNQNKTVNPAVTQQVIRCDVGQGYTGLGDVTINAVTAAIDPDIQSYNIRRGVNILGINGTYDGSSGGSGTCTPTIINLKCPSRDAWMAVNYTTSPFRGHMPYVQFPQVTITGPWMLTYLLFNTDCESVEFPNLTTLDTYNDSSGILDEHWTWNVLNMVNSTCKSASFPALTNISCFTQNMWTSAGYPFTLTTNSAVLTNSVSQSIASGLEGKLVTLHISNETIDNSIYIYSYVLNRDSVYEVLTKLAQNGSNKSCVFYKKPQGAPAQWPSGNLTITDYSDHRIQNAYNTAVSNGWTINNLTINQP